jgi:hypothetical protein
LKNNEREEQMSKKYKDVELIPVPPSGWKVKHDGKEGSAPGNYPKVELPQDSGPHLIVFTLPKDGAVSFNATDPMWVQPGSSSPTQQGMDAQIPDWAVFDGGKTLVILDSNTKAGDLSYRVKADGYGGVLDPIIKNGGFTVSGTAPAPSTAYETYSGSQIAIAAVALLVAFAAGFLLRRFLAG